MKRTFVVIVLLGLGLIPQVCQSERTIIEQAWPGAFKGRMTLSVDECTSSINGGGWTVTVVFDRPVYNIDIWRAQIISRSADNLVYELGNMNWNPVIYPNTYLELEFIGYLRQNQGGGTHGTATLNDNGLCNELTDLSSSQSSSSLPDLSDGSCEAEYELLDEWPGNFKGRVRLPISTRLSGGWTASLIFSDPVNNLQIWTASILSVSNDKRVYRLRNQQWNRRLDVGVVYEAEFIGSLSSAIIPTFSFLMEDHPACDDITSEVSSVVDNGVCSCGTVRQLIDEWGNNFKGRVRVPVTNSLTGGWTAELEFSEPVWNLQIWTALIQGIDSTFTRYTLTNQQWNSDLLAGAEFDAEFIGAISAGTPDFQIRLLNQPDCECPEYYVPTTTLPTTTIPTTTVSTTTPLTTTNPLPSTMETTVVPEVTTAEETTSQVATIYPEVTTEDGESTTLGPDATTADLESTTPNTPDVTTDEVTDETTTIAEESTTDSTGLMETTKTLPDVSTVTPKVGDYADYDEVLHKSILFYEAQRSGALPSSNRIPYRGDSALNDQGSNGESLTGGWYDAGDTVKFGLPMASSTTLLAWGIIEYQDAYISAGEYENALDSIKWATDYFMKCHVSPNEFYAQVGDGHFDHSLWVRPEELSGARPAFKLDPSNPGSDVAGETAAALAAASLIFKKDAVYSSALLTHAIQLFEFADTYRGYYSSSIPNADSFYHSSHYVDELAYAAAWLYRASGDQTYYNKAVNLYQQHGLDAKPWAFDWDDKKAGLQLMMYQLSDGTSQTQYENAVKTYLDGWMRGGDVTYTPGGLAWRSQWGSLRYSANTAFLASIACRSGLSSQYCDFAQEQIDYMLGSNGRSFVVGFGDNPPDRPHHRASSCPDLPAPCGWNEFGAPGPNPQILYGALVGGPNDRDEFVNDRSDYIQNEVACDYNAGFQSAVAGVKQLLMEGLIVANPRALW
nr:uncharacterized protein LOC129254871 [Lytechinus pictus]